MQAIILAILQKVGTEVLLAVLEEIIDMIKGRDDNSLDEKDSEAIKEVTKQVKIDSK